MRLPQALLSSKRSGWALVLFLTILSSGLAEDWHIVTGFGDDLFPSVIVSTATLKEDESDKDPLVLGDTFGLLGVALEAPEKGAKVRVEIRSRRLIEPSVFEGTLARKGKVYEIYPVLRYDYDSLLRVRQPFPEIVTVSVSLNGQSLGTKDKRMLVRSVNDCPFGMSDEDGNYTPLDILFAAYVNENHPEVDRILSEALDSGDTRSFAGYQGSADDVLHEMQAVYNALKRRGFSYSSITRPSVESDEVAAQHVRLIGDSVKTSQANCVDGSVLFASIFRKMGLDPFLVSIPGHMFVGVYLDPKGEEFACIETTMLGSNSFEEAVEAGNEQFAEHEKRLTAEDGSNPEHAIVDISAAREEGVLPLREPSAD